MAIDDPIALPKAPPPRPAARQAAIEAALRKFDGSEEATGKTVRERRDLFGWASTHRGPASALATAAIVAVVGLPIALATLRDSPRPAPQQPTASIAAQPTQEESDTADNLAAFDPSENQASADQAPSEPQAPAARQAQPSPAPMALAPVAQRVANEEPAPAMAAAPPPPPPPPPPAPAPEREGYAAEAVAQDMVVTGSRIQSSELSDRANRQAVGKSSPLVTIDTYGEFLSRLQSALKTDNRRAVSRLVGFPLSVNMDGEVKTYRSRREIESDFDQIFTPAVKAEILGLKPYALRTRADGKTKGSARLWFAPACFNAECYPPGPIRIREVTP